jgi:hypothetical protein
MPDQQEGYYSPYGYRRHVTFALMNTARGEAVPLVLGNSGSNSEFLVLPGPTVTTSLYDVENRYRTGPRGAPVAVDEQWFQKAQLVIGRWVPSATYPDSARTRIILKLAQ